MLRHLEGWWREWGMAGELALLLLAAVLSAEACQRWLRLPRMVGYVLAGMCLGPGVLNWVSSSVAGDLRLLMLLGLGVLLFELGSRVDLRWLRANPWLLVSSLAESALTFAAVYFFLDFFGLAVVVCVTVAAIAVVTSPAVVMRVVAENEARGQLTQRLLLLTALNSLYALLLLKVAMAFVHLDQGRGLLHAITQPLYVLCGSFLLGALLAYAMHVMHFSRLRRDSERFAVLLASFLIVIAVAEELALSVPMALLCGGMLLRLWSPRLLLFPEHFGVGEALLVILFFTLTGVALDPAHWLSGGLLAVGLVVLRAATKIVGASLGAGPGGLPLKKSVWLGTALLPMSGLAALQAYDVAALSDDFGREALALVLGAVLVMEVIGPIATQIALRRTGEAGVMRN